MIVSAAMSSVSVEVVGKGIGAVGEEIGFISFGREIAGVIGLAVNGVPICEDGWMRS